MLLLLQTQSGVALSTLTSSNTLTPSGYDGPLAVSVSGDGMIPLVI